MIKPNVLIIADKEDVKQLDLNRQSDHWNIFWKIIDYNRLHKSVGEIETQIKKHNPDFILYSRNDQVVKKISIGPVIKRLGIGYSSFSGIDERCRIEEMQNCFEDFVKCDNKLDFDISPPRERDLEISDNKGTFSLIFDTEQIGGVRYGLSRILELLNKYDVKATFFVTNLMKKVYSNIVEEIQAQGHDIGLHGWWHEYLSSLSREAQKNSIREMINDFGIKIHGTNFIGRINEDTVHALIENRTKYFVFPLINYYKFFCYPKLSTNPLLVSSDNGEILMIPISVETYGSPWFSIKNMVDSAYRDSLKSNKNITIQCHPFRDGNLQHIEITEKLLRHLVVEKGMNSVVTKNLSMSHERRRIEVDKIDKVNPKVKLKELIPRTKQDLYGMIPQNSMVVYRLIRRGHSTLW